MKVPRVLAKVQIKCSIWGYDAAFFVQKRYNFSFPADLHLLVDCSRCRDPVSRGSSQCVVSRLTASHGPIWSTLWRNIQPDWTTNVPRLNISPGWSQASFSPPAISILLWHRGLQSFLRSPAISRGHPIPNPSCDIRLIYRGAFRPSFASRPSGVTRPSFMVVVCALQGRPTSSVWKWPTWYWMPRHYGEPQAGKQALFRGHGPPWYFPWRNSRYSIAS